MKHTNIFKTLLAIIVTVSLLSCQQEELFEIRSTARDEVKLGLDMSSLEFGDVDIRTRAGDTKRVATSTELAIDNENIFVLVFDNTGDPLIPGKLLEVRTPTIETTDGGDAKAAYADLETKDSPIKIVGIGGLPPFVIQEFKKYIAWNVDAEDADATVTPVPGSNLSDVIAGKTMFDFQVMMTIIDNKLNYSEGVQTTSADGVPVPSYTMLHKITKEGSTNYLPIYSESIALDKLNQEAVDAVGSLKPTFAYCRIDVMLSNTSAAQKDVKLVEYQLLNPPKALTDGKDVVERTGKKSHIVGLETIPDNTAELPEGVGVNTSNKFLRGLYCLPTAPLSGLPILSGSTMDAAATCSRRNK